MALAFWIAAAASAYAATLPPTHTLYDLRGAVIYSNLCVDRATNDVDGLRIFVRPAGNTPRVLAQYAEGGLLAPVPAIASKEQGRLKFEISGDVPTARFSGVVHGDRIWVKSHQVNDTAAWLKRVRGTERPPYCALRQTRP
jgi:hypothetical protein